MAFFDDIGRKWERLAPRERRLFAALGVTFVLCVFGFVGLQIHDGLSSIEARNDKARKVLKDLDEQRQALIEARTQGQSPTPLGGGEAPPLATYLDGIAGELGVQIPESTERPPVPKGKFQERTVDIKMRGLTVRQLADFLRQVETRSQAVVTQRLFVKTYFNQHDKLDVELTVATYERAAAKATKGESKPAGDAGGEEQGG